MAANLLSETAAARIKSKWVFSLSFQSTPSPVCPQRLLANRVVAFFFSYCCFRSWMRWQDGMVFRFLLATSSALVFFFFLFAFRGEDREQRSKERFALSSYNLFSAVISLFCFVLNFRVDFARLSAIIRDWYWCLGSDFFETGLSPALLHSMPYMSLLSPAQCRECTVAHRIVDGKPSPSKADKQHNKVKFRLHQDGITMVTDSLWFVLSMNCFAAFVRSKRLLRLSLQLTCEYKAFNGRE